MRKRSIYTTLTFILLGQLAVAQQKIEFIAPGVYPEGIAYDKAANIFYVSGVRTASIGKVDIGGKYTQLFSDSTLKSTYGMKLDPAGKKLWVCAGDANYSKYRSDDTYRKMIRLISIDVSTGKKVNDIDLSQLAIGEHFANDITFDDKGNIYITDSYSPNIYKVDASGKASVFANSPMFYAAGIGLNGLVYHPSGFLLAVNSGAGCLLKINMADPKDVVKVKIPQFFPGADGLWLDDNNNLTLVQNQSVNKIFKIATKDNWINASVTMATKAEAMFAQPSTAAKANNKTWIMNSKLNELADSMHIPSKKFSIQEAVFVAVK